MAEYQPLSLMETVRVKVNHWLNAEDDQVEILNKYWDRVLFELILDVANVKGGHHSSTRIEHKSTAYEVRKGGSVVSETYSLLRVKNGYVKEVPPSKIKLRRLMLSVLSAEIDSKAEAGVE